MKRKDNRKPAEDIRIFSTALPPAKNDFFGWAKEFNVGVLVKDDSLVGNDLLNQKIQALQQQQQQKQFEEFNNSEGDE